jgi:hypothetical protein
MILAITRRLWVYTKLALRSDKLCKVRQVPNIYARGTLGGAGLSSRQVGHEPQRITALSRNLTVCWLPWSWNFAFIPIHKVCMDNASSCSLKTDATRNIVTCSKQSGSMISFIDLRKQENRKCMEFGRQNFLTSTFGRIRTMLHLLSKQSDETSSVSLCHIPIFVRWGAI